MQTQIFTREELETKTSKILKRICIDELKLPGLSKKGKGVVIDAMLSHYATLDNSMELVDVKDDEYDDGNNDDEYDENNENNEVKSNNPIKALSFNLNSIMTKPNANFGNKNITTIHVSCGASSGEFPVAGRTVFEISEFLREALNVSRMSIGLVNGKEVKDDYIVQSGDNVEYLKPAGQKG